MIRLVRGMFGLCLSIFFFCSCNLMDTFSFYRLFLSVDDTNQIKVGDLILSRGDQVGKVGRVGQDKLLNSQNHIVELLLNKGYELPKDSDVRIIRDAKHGRSHIEILKSNEKEFFQKGDTISELGSVVRNQKIQLEEVHIPLDSLPEGIRNLLK